MVKCATSMCRQLTIDQIATVSVVRGMITVTTLPDVIIRHFNAASTPISATATTTDQSPILESLAGM